MTHCESAGMPVLVRGFVPSSSKAAKDRATGVGNENKWLNCVTVIIIVAVTALIPCEPWSVLEPISQHNQACWSLHSAYCV